ncbi:N-acetyl-gamma-glutamyl-phosphate reductase, partial [Staphylococcus pasteuri]
ELNEQATSCDVIFFATPSNVSKHLVPNLINNGVKVIDLSGDFRLTDRNLYQTYYGEAAAEQDFLDSALYSIAEWSEIDS